MHAKYVVSISNCSKVIVKVKVDNRQTGQKQDAPDHSIRWQKNIAKDMMSLLISKHKYYVFRMFLLKKASFIST